MQKWFKFIFEKIQEKSSIDCNAQALKPTLKHLFKHSSDALVSWALDIRVARFW